MKFLLLSVGKAKYPFWAAAAAHYAGRIGPLADLELLEVKEAGEDVDAEGDRMLAALEKRKLLGDGRVRLIALDEKGKSRITRAFAEEMRAGFSEKNWKQVVFLVGGAYGLSDAVKKTAKDQLALSDFTLPHDLAKVVLLEQIYRALMLLSGRKYHNE